MSRGDGQNYVCRMMYLLALAQGHDSWTNKQVGGFLALMPSLA